MGGECFYKWYGGTQDAAYILIHDNNGWELFNPMKVQEHIPEY